MPRYLLDPDICFLNHGSFGAIPEELLAVQDDLRREIERQPIDFLIRQLPQRLSEARDAVAGFIGAAPSSTVFVQNATTGVNAVLGSVDLASGDEILTTDHRYDAVRNTLDRAAAAHGARVVEAQIPFPLASSAQVLDRVEAAITPRTKLMILDQIASPTALIFPVDALVALARSRGIPVLIDGAHAPGQVDVDLQRIRPDFWVGNLHKWICAPKGAAVLVVDPAWQDRVKPVVTSHGYTQGFESEFHWCGTFDPTAWLTAPAAIALHRSQGGARFRAAHHQLVKDGRQVIAEGLDVTLPHPDEPELYGAMATIPLPCPVAQTPELFTTLREEDRIEVPIIPWGGRAWVRISGFAGYNRPEQYEQLAQALVRHLR
jgi:isopenicillin-N epimerase